MSIKFNKRGFFQRLLGIPATGNPGVDGCWDYADGKLTVDLGKAVELKTPGGAIKLEGNNLPKRVLVVFGEDGNYHAYHNKCSHMGRRLDPVPGTDTVQCCSISKSTYDVEGGYLHGPKHHPILSFPIKKDQEKLIISVS
ncbi:MAG: Rieske 2Fe-2S domain-containing protein [bacterium]|nr:Rieske 2Fe-2S domain-containing protein [bacterium]